jgi:uncharacterized protein YkwD
MKKNTIPSVLLLVILLSVASCAPTVSQQEYDRVSNELSAIQSQLESLQNKLAETELLQVKYEELSKLYDTVNSQWETMQTQYEELNTRYEELNKHFDAVENEFEATKSQHEQLSTEYEELNQQFEELSGQYEIIMQGIATINEEDIEQAVFELINQERINSGLDELTWGIYLYKSALANSRNMAINKRLEYPDFGWQEVFWATGYGTADGIASAALVVWKNRLQYETNFLNKVTNHGAVGVYKSGEIAYITYAADYFK